MSGLRHFLADTGQDLRFAARMLSAAPGFSTVAVLSIALGIGANTAIFSLIDAVMWRMLPVKNPETLMAVVRTSGEAIQEGFSYQEYHVMREHNQMAELASYSQLRLNVSIDSRIEPAVDGQLVSGNYFSMLGVKPLAGRAIGFDDDRVPKGHPVAMISYAYWRRQFGMSPATIGRKILISGAPFTIIGITPAEFFGTEVGAAPDIFVPLMMQPIVEPASENLIEDRITYRTWCRILGRLRAGVSPQPAASALQVLYRQVTPSIAHTGIKRIGAVDWNVSLTPAATGLSTLRQQFSEVLFILMTVVGGVLLIACANLANLLLARAAARGPELATRIALGAGRSRLIRQLLAESLVLSIGGGACGILLARWMTRLLLTYMATGRGAIALDLAPDLRVLSFTAGSSILTGVLFGLLPALRGTRIDLWTALKGFGGFSSPRSGLRPGKILVVFQIAVSLVLMIGAELFVSSLRNLNGVESAERETVVMIPVEPRGSDQRNIPGTTRRLDQVYFDLLARVRAIPGVRSVGMSQVTPASPESGAAAPLWLMGLSPAQPFPSGEQEVVRLVMVYPSFFSTVGIPVIAGREFNESDLADNSPAVCVVNETFARHMFATENPIGRSCVTAVRPHTDDVGRPRYDSPPVPYQIVGVVQDSRYMNPRGSVPPIIFTTFLQTGTGRGQMVLYVRLAGNARAIVPGIRTAVLRVDPTLPQFEVHTLAEEMDSALIQERLIATLSTLFGVLALALACVGVYGLLAFAVVQRTGEVGIRMAVGAARGDVLWMILREALWLALAGVIIGVPAAIAAGRLSSSRISGLLFGLSVSDPSTIASVAAVMMLVAVLAGFFPAWRASHVEPMVAPRNE